MNRLIPVLLLIAILSCKESASDKETQPMSQFDVQGHRGCRGLLPENSLAAFLHAVDLGVTTLELDVVISRDSQVLVSHEPWLSSTICRSPDGAEIASGSEAQWNMFDMDYKTIRACDCGSRPHPSFPDQQLQHSFKPLLSEVIEAVEAHIKAHKLPRIHYNIETKCSPEGDNLFHPAPEAFTSLLLAVIENQRVAERCLIQSFDPRTLRIARELAPDMKLVLLVEGDDDFITRTNDLGFLPDVYSPSFDLVSLDMRTWTSDQGIKLIPWTVNEVDDMKQMIELGVDGIITDYPDRLIELLKTQE